MEEEDKEDKQKAHHFKRHSDAIIQEFFNIEIIKFNLLHKRSSESYFTQLYDTIGNAKFYRKFVPKSFNSVLKARRRIAEKNNLQYEGLDTKLADAVIRQNNLEHIETYKEYQQAQLVHVNFMNFDQ